MTQIHEMMAKHIRYPYHIGNEVPETPAYQTMHFGRNTVRLLATHPDLHKRIRELTKAYGGKGVASRHVPLVNDMCSRYMCIPSVDWLRQHQHDPYPEPTIDITVAGQTFSVDSNYKAGMIQGFMGQFCKPGEGKIRLVEVKS